MSDGMEGTLTDAELVEMEKWAGNYAGGICGAAQRYWADVPRLIAAFRAERVENDRLTKRLSRQEQLSWASVTPTDEELAEIEQRMRLSWFRDDMDRLVVALRASQAEVERLTAEINERDRIVAHAFRVDL